MGLESVPTWDAGITGIIDDGLTQFATMLVPMNLYFIAAMYLVSTTEGAKHMVANLFSPCR